MKFTLKRQPITNEHGGTKTAMWWLLTSTARERPRLYVRFRCSVLVLYWQSLHVRVQVNFTC